MGALETAADGADLGNAALTHFVLIALGILIVVLTVVACFGWLPSLRIVPDDTKFDFTRFRRISFPISAALSIVAITLFFIGTGPVRGFAVTLGIGIITTVFTAFTLTRLIVAWWVRYTRPQRLAIS